MSNAAILKDFVPRKPIYTMKEAAAYLCVTDRTIRNFIKRGLLRKSRAISRRTLIAGEDVETFLARTS